MSPLRLASTVRWHHGRAAAKLPPPTETSANAAKAPTKAFVVYPSEKIAFATSTNRQLELRSGLVAFVNPEIAVAQLTKGLS
jgi:hypothetical protein